MKVATYRRVSSKAQTATDRLSLDAQARAIDALCTAHGATTRYDFIDPGSSAWTNNLERLQGLSALLERLKDKDIEAIILGADADRIIGRKLGLQAIVFAALADHSIKLITPSKTFDPDNEGDRLFLRFYGVVSEAESDVKSRRVRSAKEERAKVRGLHNSAAVPFGYASAGKSVPLVIVTGEAPVIRFIFESYATGGYSFRSLASEVRERWPWARTRNVKRQDTSAFPSGPRPFSETTIDSIIRNACFYAGQVQHKGEWFPGKHEPIIDPLVADACSPIMRSHTRAPHGSSKPHWRAYRFKGLIRCAACGGRLAGMFKYGRAYYRAERRRRDGECSVCAGRYIRESDLDVQLFSIMGALRDARRAEIEGQLEAPATPTSHAARQRTLEERRRRLGVLYADQVVDEAEYKASLAKVNTEIATLIPVSVPITATALDDPLWALWRDPQTPALGVNKFLWRTLDAVFLNLREHRVTSVAPKPVLRLGQHDEAVREAVRRECVKGRTQGGFKDSIVTRSYEAPSAIAHWRPVAVVAA